MKSRRHVPFATVALADAVRSLFARYRRTAACTLVISLVALQFTTSHLQAGDSPDAASIPEDAATATFAGGCFWCMEHPFDKLDGVFSTTSGYMGGKTDNPTYEQISGGGTGHAEVVQVVFDPDTISYETLLDTYWKNVDPLTENAQFCDVGSQYRSAIFFADDAQAKLARESKQALTESERFDQPVVTEIAEASEFYPAEDYHQDYYKKNPLRYRLYRTACGRDNRLQEVWGQSS